MDTLPTPPTQTPPRPVTIQDIAAALGIHKATVSKALAGKGQISPTLREKVLSFARDQGYEPNDAAQRLASRDKSQTICLCSGSLSSGVSMDKISLIQGALTKLGYEVPFYAPAKFSGDSPDAQISLLRQLRQQRPQAIVCSVHSFHVAALAELERYQDEGGIVVTLDLPIPLACDQVVFDRAGNAYAAAHYLLKQGHRYLGLVVSSLVGARASNLNAPQNLREAGFLKALSDWKEEVPEPWIFENPNFEHAGVELTQHFLGLEKRPTAMCIVSDYVALAFMGELQRAGVSVPDDVSIIGQEDQIIAPYFPVPLTSISHPVPEIVDAVINLLVARLEGDTSPPKTTVIHGHLVERQSVASPSSSSETKKKIPEKVGK